MRMFTACCPQRSTGQPAARGAVTSAIASSPMGACALVLPGETDGGKAKKPPQDGGFCHCYICPRASGHSWEHRRVHPAPITLGRPLHMTIQEQKVRTAIMCTGVVRGCIIEQTIVTHQVLFTGAQAAGATDVCDRVPGRAQGILCPIKCIPLGAEAVADATCGGVTIATPASIALRVALEWIILTEPNLTILDIGLQSSVAGLEPGPICGGLVPAVGPVRFAGPQIRQKVVIIRRIAHNSQSDLLQVREASGLSRLASGLGEHGEKYACQDCDDGYDNQ